MSPEAGLLFQSMKPPARSDAGRTLRYALKPPAAALAVVQYPSEGGLYLLYLDAAGSEVTDTRHATLDDALLRVLRKWRRLGGGRDERGSVGLALD
jgi:hypothetical protein